MQNNNSLYSRLAAIEQQHREWKSECWNPINPHALTCQTSPTKPCELCAAIIQAHRDCADTLATCLPEVRQLEEENKELWRRLSEKNND